jgi:hypothetical protein
MIDREPLDALVAIGDTDADAVGVDRGSRWLLLSVALPQLDCLSVVVGWVILSDVLALPPFSRFVS